MTGLVKSLRQELRTDCVEEPTLTTKPVSLPIKVAARNLVRSLHGWTGLVLGALLIVQAATGLVLLYREEITDALVRDLTPAARSMDLPDVDAVLIAAHRAYAGRPIERIVFPRGHRRLTFVYHYGDGIAGRIVSVYDPGSVAGLRPLSGPQLLAFVVFRWHDEVLIGRFGHALVMLEGGALGLFIVSGLYLWWPLRRQGLAVRWNAPKAQRYLTLHRTLGVGACAFLAVTAFTGVMMEVSVLASPSGALPGKDADPASLPRLDGLVRNVAAQYRPGALEDIRFSPDGRTATISAYASGLIRPMALDRTVVDRRAGQVAEVQRASQEPGPAAAMAWMYPIHTAKAWGGVGRLMATVIGVALISLPVAGISLWLQRRRVKRSLKRQS